MARHNKKRNTAFIFEALTREIVKQSIEGDNEKRNVAISILKESFTSNTELRKELELYKSIYELDSDIDKPTAEKILQEAKQQYKDLDLKKIFDEQSSVISKINKRISKNVFNNFVPNYKDLASLAQVFNGSLKPKNRVLLENSLIEKMSNTPNIEEADKVSPLVVKTFIKRFNSEYSSLLENQKRILNKFILSFQDGELEFKYHLNEELGNVKERLEALRKDSYIQNNQFSEKIGGVIESLESLKETQDVKKTMLATLKAQALIAEIETDEH